MPGMTRWTPVVLALAIFLAGGTQADPASVSVTGELEVVIADDFEHQQARTFFFAQDPTDVAVSGTSYTDRNTTSGASYAYTVHALDAVGNESGASNAVSLTLGGKSLTLGGGGSGPGGAQGGGKGRKK